MERDALIQLLLERTKPGDEIEVLDGNYGIYDVDVSWVLASKRRKKNGPRWPTDNAKFGLFVLHYKGKVFTK